MDVAAALVSSCMPLSLTLAPPPPLPSPLSPQDLLRPHLQLQTAREVETAAYVGERVRAALDVLKPCATESMRMQYYIVGSAAAPPRAKIGDTKGMGKRVAAFLGLRRGRRSKAQGGRPYAFDKFQDARTKFDAAAQRLLGPLGHLFVVGQCVLTRHGPAEIVRLTSDGGVVVLYSVGEAYAERTYSERTGNKAGSARLQRMPPSLLPPSRAQRSDTTTLATKKAVLEHTEEFCPTSPSGCDIMRRKLGPFIFEEKPALILSDVLESMYASFKEKHALIKLSFSKYKEVVHEVAWNLKKAYRSGGRAAHLRHLPRHLEPLLIPDAARA